MVNAESVRHSVTIINSANCLKNELAAQLQSLVIALAQAEGHQAIPHFYTPEFAIIQDDLSVTWHYYSESGQRHNAETTFPLAWLNLSPVDLQTKIEERYEAFKQQEDRELEDEIARMEGEGGPVNG